MWYGLANTMPADFLGERRVGGGCILQSEAYSTCKMHDRSRGGSALALIPPSQQESHQQAYPKGDTNYRSQNCAAK
jgi:hypothetical protein